MAKCHMREMSRARGAICCDRTRFWNMEYDVVETSDIEELEELRAPLYSERAGFHDGYLSDDQHSPRKRVKVSLLAIVS